jgi:hypothetical protein
MIRPKKKFGVLEITKYLIFIVFATWAFYYISELTSKDKLSEAFNNVPWWVYLGSILGSFINWTWESLKWHKLINTIQYSSLLTSSKAVYSGAAVNNILPYKIGEYLGKLYYVKADKRALSVPLSFISSTIQLLVNLTLCIGPAIYLLGLQATQKLNFVNMAIIFIAIIIGIFLVQKSTKTKDWITKLKENFKLLTINIIAQITLFATMRFLSFLLAYVFIIYSLTDLNLTQIIIGICAIYFMQSFAPGMVLTDGPVRILLPIMVFIPMGVPETTLIVAAIINYLASVILPSLFGVFFILLRKT